MNFSYYLKEYIAVAIDSTLVCNYLIRGQIKNDSVTEIIFVMIHHLATSLDPKLIQF